MSDRVDPRHALRVLVMNTVRETAAGTLNFLNAQGLLHPPPPTGALAELADAIVKAQIADWDTPEAQQMLDRIIELMGLQP